MTQTYEEEMTWLQAQVENIARRHGQKPEDIADDLINRICNL